MTKHMTANAFANLWASAHIAGDTAAKAARPTPMVVTLRANPLDDSSPVVKTYPPVMDGACGFATIHFAGNTAFGRWAKKTGRARKDSYYGGLYVSVADYGQSYERKYAYARAFAKVLEDFGISAWADARLD